MASNNNGKWFTISLPQPAYSFLYAILINYYLNVIVFTGPVIVVIMGVSGAGKT